MQRCYSGGTAKEQFRGDSTGGWLDSGGMMNNSE